MGILFCPPKYRTNGLDPVMWSSSRLAGYLRWIQQIAPSDAAAGFLWIGESVLEQARWFLHAGGVWQHFSSSWIGLFGRWIRFGTRWFRHRSGGTINSLGKRFSFSAVLLSNVFAEIDEFEWILTSEMPLESIFSERTPFYWTSFLHAAEPALRRWEQE